MLYVCEEWHFDVMIKAPSLTTPNQETGWNDVGPVTLSQS